MTYLWYSSNEKVVLELFSISQRENFHVDINNLIGLISLFLKVSKRTLCFEGTKMQFSKESTFGGILLKLICIPINIPDCIWFKLSFPFDSIFQGNWFSYS